MKIYIRNMACESCKIVVKEALDKLRLHPLKVELGEADIRKTISPAQKKKLNDEIGKAGLELVESKGGILIEKIRKHIMEYIGLSKLPAVNFSDYLAAKLNYEYNYLSNFFSEVEGRSITHYMNAVKMERAKEMIMFEDHTLLDVAEKLHYTSLSSFSAQFKKITGFPPSHFKKLRERRRSIQELKEPK